MALRLEQKKTIVDEVTQSVSTALSLVAADYRGLTAADMTQLRADARKVGVKLKIVRNTLARKALQGTSFECMADSLVGPILLAFASAEPGASARLLRDFAKANEKLEIKALSLDGKLLGKDQVDVVACLPTKDEAIAKLLSVMQAPIAKLVRTIAEPQAKLVRTIAAVRDKKCAESA
jgi:large subunit ribosomal protein L10